MNVLVVGSGGREHALVRKLRESPRVDRIFCAPGNGGISLDAECVDLRDFAELAEFAKKNDAFTVVGPDDALADGIAEAFEGLPIFAPTKRAAIIEYSKSYSKALMKKYNIPTAAYEVFDNYADALAYARKSAHPLVVKADGLALGKGVTVCQNLKQSEDALKEAMLDKKFGDSGNTVVIEEFLTGREVSVLAFCDGKTIVPMVSAQDHKQVFDGNQGANTGGMGTISPSPYYTDEMAKTCFSEIFEPTLKALAAEGREFVGVLFFGLMITADGVKVIEYNARFGDPETQVVLLRLKTDLFDILEACVFGTLDKIKIEWEDNAAACVILASGGYPQAYKKGYEISELSHVPNVFHAGTIVRDGKIFTNGGRVLGVAGVGDTLEKAVSAAYEGVSKIHFEGVHYRKDIGKV
ncbi:phosphoribosylamine--glycine ligase [Clostridia bacterium]|nr:phosphoribosylamine--glycine ligase [Clostridia bacterium]